MTREIIVCQGNEFTKVKTSASTATFLRSSPRRNDPIGWESEETVVFAGLGRKPTLWFPEYHVSR